MRKRILACLCALALGGCERLGIGAPDVSSITVHERTLIATLADGSGETCIIPRSNVLERRVMSGDVTIAQHVGEVPDDRYTRYCPKDSLVAFTTSRWRYLAAVQKETHAFNEKAKRLAGQ
ncbi:MAG: hypothetical protein WA021_03465 [Minisyncoccia bacterium]